MIDPAILRAMLNAGCTAEQIVAVVEEAARAEEEKRREKRMKDAERQRRHRANKAMSRDVTHVTRDKCDTPSSEVSPHTPLPNSNPIPPSPPKGGSSPVAMGEFDEFWSIYPHKIGKPKAREAFLKARKRAGFDVIMAGLRAYVAKTDDRPWCNPATWLNQDRWEDIPAPMPQRQAAAPPSDRSRMNETLDLLIAGANHEPDHITIDASLHGSDRRSPEGPVQRLALPARD